VLNSQAYKNMLLNYAKSAHPEIFSSIGSYLGNDLLPYAGASTAVNGNNLTPYVNK